MNTPPDPPNDTPTALWTPCQTCGGQGFTIHQHDGHTWRQPCPTCIGVGSDIRNEQDLK